MKLLAIDTATEICSVALATDGATIERIESGQRHGERLLAMVEEVMQEAGFALTQLDAIAFGRGPGSFTSLRIGAGVVQGLAFGADLPVIPVSSLAAVAQDAGAEKVLAALDARMQQVYWAEYIRNADGLATLLGAEMVCDPEKTPFPTGNNWTGAGSGWDVYADVLSRHLGERIVETRPNSYPYARHVATLAMPIFREGNALSAEQALPVYVRDNVATKTSK